MACHPLIEELGPQLVSFRTQDQHHNSSYMDPDGVPVATADVLGGGGDTQIVALYFAAAAEQTLTPYLRDTYKALTARHGAAFEVRAARAFGLDQRVNPRPPNDMNRSRCGVRGASGARFRGSIKE